MTQITERRKTLVCKTAFIAMGFFKNIIPVPSLVNCLCQMHASQFETGEVLLKAISFTNIRMYDEPLEQ